MKINRFIWTFVLVLFGLSACTSNQYALPLADDKPTLLFFYTEN
jgi:hypothetical protein